ncbi:MAG TPA: hypothetical protein VN703_02850 [Candidatus Sulfopaludibacter sp.]|nr:hypothetical protein [Candidatus Sulfopaludibacter sp.]
MKNNIYQRAFNNGCFLESTCVGMEQYEWDKLMKGHTKANKRKVVKIALLAGVIEEEQATEEIKKSYYNPYTHYKTKTHIIYVHSMIEHFIKVN